MTDHVTRGERLDPSAHQRELRITTMAEWVCVGVCALAGALAVCTAYIVGALACA